jgi:hypothetical protein
MYLKKTTVDYGLELYTLMFSVIIKRAECTSHNSELPLYKVISLLMQSITENSGRASCLLADDLFVVGMG